MLRDFNLRDPVLINTIGHSAGLLLFGFMIALLIRDRQEHGLRPAKLPLTAAVLAFAWNVGSLVALGVRDPNSHFIEIVMAASFSVLTALPAILLHLALKDQQKPIIMMGYGLCACAICLHLLELFVPSAVPHQIALLLVAVGFAVLTVAALLVRWRIRASNPAETTEWFPLTCLVLFTTSFTHFGYEHHVSPWAAEIAWHHIGIPVALLVLLRDYRFLLLDTFIRFLMNSLLAGSYLVGILVLYNRLSLSHILQSDLFAVSLALVGVCVSLIVFANTRNTLQRWVGRVIFRRQNLDEYVHRITQLFMAARSENEMLNAAAAEVARYLRADQFAVLPDTHDAGALTQPTVLFEDELKAPIRLAYPWAEARIPLRFSRGEVCSLLTGPRAGHQRYLSEDLEDMRRLGGIIVEQVERFRAAELKQLASKAELRALQAQINPHFLFNALNTLYGTIDRGSHEARRMVLNLAEIFRYFLQGDRSFIPLSEELRIIQAYLEIEHLRLGDRLRTELFVSDAASEALIPVLSIQPIVENAVKHGVAANPGAGRVTLRAEVKDGMLRVSVEDTGSGFQKAGVRDNGGAGTGLENVRRRLILAYGPDASLDVQSSEDGSAIHFRIPATPEQVMIHAG